MFWVSKPCSRFDEPYWIYRYLQFKAKQHLWFVAICLLPCLHKRWVKEHSGAIKFSFCRPCNFTKTCIHMKLDPSCMQINKYTRQLFISFSFAVWHSRLSGNYCNSIFVAHNQLATFTYHSLRITTAATTIACQTYVAAISVCCMHLLHIHCMDDYKASYNHRLGQKRARSCVATLAMPNGGDKSPIACLKFRFAFVVRTAFVAVRRWATLLPCSCCWRYLVRVCAWFCIVVSFAAWFPPLSCYLPLNFLQSLLPLCRCCCCAICCRAFKY